MICSVSLIAASQIVTAQSLVKYVQPMAGSGIATTPAALKHGSGFALFANTIPAVTTPFAMTQWTPQTQTSENKCVPPYYYKDNMFSGIRGSHWLSGSCTQDYGSVSIMPISGTLQTVASQYAARFSHPDEKSAPYRYSINLKAYHIKAEVTSTARCAIMRFTAQQADSVYLLITPNSDYNKGYVKIDKATGEVYGYNPVHRIYQGWGKEAGFDGHFVIKFDRKAGNSGTYTEDKVSSATVIHNKKAIGAYLGFKLNAGETLQVRVGTSFSNVEGARKNLQAEIPGWNFESVAVKTKLLWEQTLSQIKLQTPVERDKRIFYTSYYHALQQPRLYNDVDGTYPKFASNHQLAKLKTGNYYDDFSLWDIYRAHLPLMEILQPKVVNNFVQSLILKGQQGGYLSIFPCWNSYTSEMIGDHSTSAIASAYIKGISKAAPQEAYRLMRQNAFNLPANKADYEEGKGRRALNSYLKYGYIPLEDSVPDAFHKKEQVSRVLEYAYDDYALAQVALKLGKKADYDTLMKHAKYYENVFDKNVGLVRGKHADGIWVTPYHPDGKEDYITEGTPRQYTFYVPQDVPGLAKLMGGATALEKALDTLFHNNEYWHGNEPGHQIPFMYNYTASPWKTQLQVRNILEREYSDGPGGLSGNDDAGQMSAWYMFAAMGMYPLNPVSGQYLLCSPLFNRTTVRLTNDKSFEIVTHKTGKNAMFIYKVMLNGKKLSNNYLTYNEIISGGQLDIYLQDKPDKTWGAQAVSRPSGITLW